MAVSSLRRTVGALFSLLLASLVVTGLAGTAHADDGYEYWNYFHAQDGAWQFSDKGPAQVKPEDGSVEGFRYGVSTVSQGIEPRADLAEVDFDAVCEGVKAGDGEKQVAVLLDFGTVTGHGTPPAARGECAVVADNATAQVVLDEVADVRVEGGMTCGIDGYPATGCGEPVKDATVATDEQPVAFDLPSDSADTDAASSESADEDSSMLAPLLGVGVVVVLIAAGGLFLSRRNRTA